MTRRDPHLVLAVAPDASPAAIKAAWRRLARENHPDLTAGDPVASRAATRRMAEINAAYQELRDRVTAAAKPNGASGPPRPRPTRPVTGRVDTSDTFRPRNQATSHGLRGARAPGQPPRRRSTVHREPPRASEPNGPLRRSRARRFRPPEPPPLAEALGRRIEFGKFNGHTLGEIAAFEPSYIDWVASTITRDPDLVAAARVIRDDFDVRGTVRRRRADRLHGHPAD